MIELINFRDKDEFYLLMYKWCSKEFIYEWFEQRKLSYDEIYRKYRNKLLSRKEKLYIIYYNNKPIGYTQIYKYENSKNVYEYDLFIGEEEYLNKGIGELLVKYINKYIYDNNKVEAIILRPFKRNVRAIKCYLKCGFKIIDEYMGTDTVGKGEEYVVLEYRKDR
jgi:aminoglycoside 6'-N-acetyltransferase